MSQSKVEENLPGLQKRTSTARMNKDNEVTCFWFPFFPPQKQSLLKLKENCSLMAIPASVSYVFWEMGQDLCPVYLWDNNGVF